MENKIEAIKNMQDKIFIMVEDLVENDEEIDVVAMLSEMLCILKENYGGSEYDYLVTLVDNDIYEIKALFDEDYSSVLRAISNSDDFRSYDDYVYHDKKNNVLNSLSMVDYHARLLESKDIVLQLILDNIGIYKTLELIRKFVY